MADGSSRALSVEVAFGAASIGNLRVAMTDDEAAEVLEAAWEGGIRSFDTAPHYGLGLSERRLGAFLRCHPTASYRLSTKAGRLLVPVPEPHGRDAGFDVPAASRRVWDPSEPGLRRGVEESLARLGVDHIDMLYLHDPDDYDLDDAVARALPALERMRDDGVVGGVGVGTNSSAAALTCVQAGTLDEVMIAGEATLLVHDAWLQLMPACGDRGVGVASAAIFNSGILSSAQPDPARRFNYGAAGDDVRATVEELVVICRAWGVELPTAALQAPTRDPRVTRLVVGARTVAQVRDTVERLRVDTPEEFWLELHAAGLLPDALRKPRHFQGTSYR
jgi:D-threo-aldose 1-dehydrogenase